jgi:hypothetical protein
MVINPDGINLSENMDLYLIFKVGFIENVLYIRRTLAENNKG